MSKSAFASLIISKMNSAIARDGQGYSSGTPNVANAAVADAVTTYIIANTTVMIAYKGIMKATPHPADPVVVDTFKVVGTCAPPTGTDFGSWIKSLQNNIVSGFSLAPSGAAGVVFPCKPIQTGNLTISLGDLTNIHTGNDTNPQTPVWEHICEKLLDWLNNPGTVNKTSGVASRPVSDGTANCTSIIIS